jgi:hypothetical protein
LTGAIKTNVINTPHQRKTGPSGPFVIESTLAYLLVSSSFASLGSEAPWLADSRPVRV